MRLLILAHRVPYPPNKGEKIRTYHQIKYLRACGHQIVVFAVVHEEEDRLHASALAENLGIEVFVETARFRLLRLLVGLFTSHTLSVCNFRLKRLQRRFNDYIHENRPDAVLCTGSAMASYVFGNAFLSQKATSKPVLIMDFMDLDSDKWNQYSKHSHFPMSLLYSREAWLLSKYEKNINEHFSSCLFVSQNEVDLFLKQGLSKPNNVLVVGNGVDMESFYPANIIHCPGKVSNLNQGFPDMVFTGVMDYLPNEDAVIWFMENVWARIRECWPEARFTIAGMSPSERVNRQGLLQGVEVTGKVNSILPYFHRANIFVAPFRLARGIQNKILQAFASGVPVVTSVSGAEGIQCVDGIHLLIAETPDEYLQAVSRLMNEPALHRSIRDNALTLVRERYSWQGQNKALLDCLIKDAVEERRLP